MINKLAPVMLAGALTIPAFGGPWGYHCWDEQCEWDYDNCMWMVGFETQMCTAAADGDYNDCLGMCASLPPEEQESCVNLCDQQKAENEEQCQLYQSVSENSCNFEWAVCCPC